MVYITHPTSWTFLLLNKLNDLGWSFALSGLYADIPNMMAHLPPTKWGW